MRFLLLKLAKNPPSLRRTNHQLGNKITASREVIIWSVKRPLVKTALVCESECSRDCNERRTSGRSPDGNVPNFRSNDDWQLNFDRNDGNANDNFGFAVLGETVILCPFWAEFYYKCMERHGQSWIGQLVLFLFAKFAIVRFCTNRWLCLIGRTTS